jgi:hypothetical protein
MFAIPRKAVAFLNNLDSIFEKLLHQKTFLLPKTDFRKILNRYCSVSIFFRRDVIAPIERLCAAAISDIVIPRFIS